MSTASPTSTRPTTARLSANAALPCSSPRSTAVSGDPDDGLCDGHGNASRSSGRDIPAIVERWGVPSAGGQHYRAAGRRAPRDRRRGRSPRLRRRGPGRASHRAPDRARCTTRDAVARPARRPRRGRQSPPPAVEHLPFRGVVRGSASRRRTGKLLARRASGRPRRPARAQPARLRADPPPRGRGRPRVGRLAHDGPGRRPQGPAAAGSSEVAPGRRVRRVRLHHRRRR